MTQELPKPTIEIRVVMDRETGQVLSVHGPLHQKMFCMVALSMAQIVVANHTEPVVRPATAVPPARRDVIPFNGGQG